MFNALIRTILVKLSNLTLIPGLVLEPHQEHNYTDKHQKYKIYISKCYKSLKTEFGQS